MNSTPVTETYLSKNGTRNNDTGMDPLNKFYLVSSVIIIVLGLTGNGLVIWIAGFKVRKSVISIWYLSLAVSDFLFCSTLPFLLYYVIKRTGIFGQFMCYLIYFTIPLNLYCSVFLLTIISVDRCVIVMFPVWAQNQRTVKKASMVVVLVWFTSAIFNVTALVIPHYENDWLHDYYCYVYTFSASMSICNSIFGFLIPFLIIITCCFIIIRKLKTMQMVSSKKPFRIMIALSATFLICWLPYHIVTLMYVSTITNRYNKILNITEIFTLILMSLNSCLNPFLYAFMGKDFKKQFYAILSNIENAMEDEDNQSTDRGTNLTHGGSQHTTTISSVL